MAATMLIVGMPNRVKNSSHQGDAICSFTLFYIEPIFMGRRAKFVKMRQRDKCKAGLAWLLSLWLLLPLSFCHRCCSGCRVLHNGQPASSRCLHNLCNKSNEFHSEKHNRETLLGRSDFKASQAIIINRNALATINEEPETTKAYQ